MKHKFNNLVRIAGLGWLVLTPATPVLAALPPPTPPTSLESEFVLSRFIPDILDGQVVYPSVPVTLDLDPLTVYQWEKVLLPPGLDGRYYIEIWDAQNKPIPQFTARRISLDVMDISTIDATLYPKIRIVVFRPDTVPEFDYTQPIYFQYHTSFNTQLVAFGIFVLIVLSVLLGAALHFKLGLKELVSGSKEVLRGSAVDRFSVKGMVISGLLVLIWSGWFGVALGTYVGGVQVFYLLIKTPFMLLISLVFSVLAIGVLSLLLGMRVSLKEMLAQSLSSLAAMSLAMAAFTPIILFYISIPQDHDQLLVSTVAFFMLAGCLAALTVYRWARGHHSRLAWLITLLWVVLYGVVVLQLGWLLRPWVGVLDPIHGSVPFSRFYSGNVFIELIRTVLRLNSL